MHVHALTRSQLLSVLSTWADRRASRTRRMYYTNAHVFNLAVDDVDFARSLNRAEMLIFEGFGGCLAAQLLGNHRPEQLATMDWIDDFLADLARNDAKIHLVGDEPGVAQRCAAEMTRRHPGLRVTGTQHGYFEHGTAEGYEVVRSVAAAGANVLMVGMGSPLQERWIDQHLDRFDVPLVLALGAMFRWYAIEEPRAPRWLRNLHLEWLLRLLRHPIRHFHRYAIGNPRFLIRVLRERRLRRQEA